jgi:hypothetical protein
MGTANEPRVGIGSADMSDDRTHTETDVKSAQRLEYSRPTLRRIGSVHELTLSGGVTVSDGTGTLAPNGTGR